MKHRSFQNHEDQGITGQDIKNLSHKAGASIMDILHKSSVQEKIILLSSIAAIVLTFTPWASMEGLTISGTSHFIKLIGYLIIATSAYAATVVIGSIYGKSFGDFFGTSGKMHVILGIQIIQLGLIAYSIFSGFLSFSVQTPAISSTLLLIIACGVAIMGAGLYEHAEEETKQSRMVLHHHEKKEHKEHELHSLLKKKRKK